MIFRAKVLAAAVSAVLLSACGGTEHNVTRTAQPAIAEEAKATESEKEADHDEHDHDEGVTDVAGRLVVSSANSNVLHVYSTSDQALIESIGLTHIPDYLYGSEGHRYAISVQRADGMVEFLDGGLYQEAHDDHFHAHQDAPAAVSFHLESVKPTHVTVNEGGIVVFSDGDEASQQSASVAVFNESHISGQNTEVAVLEYSTHMHGAAQARGEYLISTLRDSSSESILPSQIGLFHAHGDHFDSEKVFDVSCPGLHGSAQNEETIVFGCADGVALITQGGQAFSATKIANPESFAEGQHVGALKGHHHSDQYIAKAGAQLFMLDTHEAEFEALEWQVTNDHSISHYGFSASGEHIIVMDSAGKLNVFAAHGHDGEHHWEAEHEVMVSESALVTGQSFSLALSQAEEAVFVSDSANKLIKKFDLEAGEWSQTFELDIVPSKLVWLGIAKSEAAHDEHEH
ncbi:hypothetical protein PRUB_a3199 [Pseudoalteromonas rubra]|uniref:5-methyltetrahydrofolate--homocysteine methyltransferase n=1 Tax=Pseudoalteromonas rubra TaxID=43658 RepID=A0A8T0CDR8_9GAMM|nr:hypothetical protein [Pseudoalteromonas rubra]KAF7788508.1 hypothetical protein PRUB_a3199 [Pseudoalteromonas rubra]